MDAATGQIQFTNHHLSDDIPVRQLKTRTKALNWYHWRMETLNSGKVNMRDHSIIIRNAQCTCRRCGVGTGFEFSQKRGTSVQEHQKSEL